MYKDGALPNSQIAAKAAALVKARLSAKAIDTYPGRFPDSLQEAYAIQDEAIRLWPDQLAGWKVGRIGQPWAAQLGTDRLAGPIFTRQVARYDKTAAKCFVFERGFGAIEAEIVFLLALDAPVHKTSWTREEALSAVECVMLGAEIASSPFREVNDHGPLVTISDFGNNNGLVLGPVIGGGEAAESLNFSITTEIDGREFGRASPNVIPGGPIESLRALLELSAARGLPLQKGMLVSTGAITGIHVVQSGQTVVLSASPLPEREIRLVVQLQSQVCGPLGP